jgi:hypothetical protein
MDMADVLLHLSNGRRVRRPHWPTGSYLLQELFYEIPVAFYYGEEWPKKAVYSFPLNDLINDDWELC